MKTLKIAIALIFNFQFSIFNCYTQSPVNSVGSGCTLEFDGYGNYIQISNALPINFSTNDFSVSFWIYPQRDATQSIIGKRMFCNGSNMWDIRQVTGKLIFFEVSTSYPSVYGSISCTFPNLNQWYHITMVRKQDSLLAYVNGILQNKIKASGGIANISNAASIHISNDPCIGADGTVFFQGQIDEVRIWNYARTEAEIRRDMCRRLTGTEPGLVGYWRFDDCGGSIAIDSSPNGNNGTLY